MFEITSRAKHRLARMLRGHNREMGLRLEETGGRLALFLGGPENGDHIFCQGSLFIPGNTLPRLGNITVDLAERNGEDVIVLIQGKPARREFGSLNLASRRKQ